TNKDLREQEAFSNQQGVFLPRLSNTLTQYKNEYVHIVLSDEIEYAFGNNDEIEKAFGAKDEIE
ncbi:hypothetical protein AVEN_56495-1, partial [Araneus ventricosus]